MMNKMKGHKSLSYQLNQEPMKGICGLSNYDSIVYALNNFLRGKFRLVDRVGGSW